MTDHATLRRMCAAQADVPSALVLELLDDLSDLREYVHTIDRRRDEQAKLIGRVRTAVLGMVNDCHEGHADPFEVRPYAHALLGLIDGPQS